MTLTLDPATEKRIQREIDLGRYREPCDVVAHAVELLEEASDLTGRRAVASGQAIDNVFGLWADRAEDAVAFQERMRSEWS